MKKAIIISSTPRRNGNSDILCDQFIKGADEKGIITEKILLKDKKINYCTGCGVCSELQKPCPQKDDMAEILQKLIDADIIVLATPVYFYTMCGQLKTFIDRCCSRYTEMTNKEFYFIVTAADDSIPAMQSTIDGFKAFLSCLTDPEIKGVVYGVGAWKTGEINNTSAMHEAYEMGDRKSDV